MKKSKKKPIIITVISIIVIILLGGAVAAYSFMASKHNKDVDAFAATLEQEIDKTTMDLSNEAVDTETAFANLVTLSVIYNCGGIDEASLTYFDGSKTKYNEIYKKVEDMIEAYSTYFKNKHESVFANYSLDINAARPEELQAAFDALTALKDEVAQAYEKTLFGEGEDKSSWSMIWGNTEEEATANYTNFMEKINQKIEEIKGKLLEAGAVVEGSTVVYRGGGSGGSGGSGGGGGYNNNKDAQARAVARQIAASISGSTDLQKIERAAQIVAEYCNRGTYTMEGEDYSTAYGVFISGQYSCAGATRALGMVLDYMGYSWTHVNPNAYTHQWCIVYNVDGQQAWADGQIGMAGYGQHPYV